jgi:hypothetical protein
MLTNSGPLRVDLRDAVPRTGDLPPDILEVIASALSDAIIAELRAELGGSVQPSHGSAGNQGRLRRIDDSATTATGADRSDLRT